MDSLDKEREREGKGGGMEKENVKFEWKRVREVRKEFEGWGWKSRCVVGLAYCSLYSNINLGPSKKMFP